MSNYFERVNIYLLIDVDGVILPAGEELRINEPEGVGSTSITLKRGKNHGVDYEFSDEKSPFEFDRIKYQGESISGYELLDDILEANGGDGNCLFTIKSTDRNGNNERVDYLGDIDFETYKKTDIVFRVSSRRINFNDQIRTRSGTVIDMESIETVDGNPISINPNFFNNVFLHSIAISLFQKGTRRFGGLGIDSPQNSQDYFVQWGYDGEVLSTFPSVLVTDYNNQLFKEYGAFGLSQIVENKELLESQFFFEKVKGILKINYDAEHGVTFNNFGGTTVTYKGTYLEITGPNQNESFTLNPGDTSLPSMGDVNSTRVVSFTFDGEFNLMKDSKVLIYDIWNIPVNTNITQSISPSGNGVLEAEFEKNQDGVIAGMIQPFRAMSKILESITGDNTILDSPFLENTLARFGLINGYKLRGLDVSMKLSYDELLESIKAIFGVGVAQSFDGSGNLKIRIDRYSGFYNDVQIGLIENVVDGSVEFEFDEEYAINNIEVGYTKYPRETNENKQGNLVEFNSKQDLITSIKKTDNSKKYVSDISASGYLITNSIAERVEDIPETTVSNDDDIFIVKTSNSGEYENTGASTTDIPNVKYISSSNTIELRGVFYDLINGYNITVTSSSTSVTGVIQDVSINGSITVVELDSVPVTGTVSDTGNVSVVINSVVLRERASTSEEFDVKTNVGRPETVYNLGINPQYIMMNHSPLFLSGLAKKDETDIVRVQRSILNENYRSQFKEGEGAYILDSEREEVGANANLALSQINGNQNLFTGRKVRLKAYLSKDFINIIRSAYQEINDSAYYGYLSFVDFDGNTVNGYLIDIKYKLLEMKADVYLREKA